MDELYRDPIVLMGLGVVLGLFQTLIVLYLKGINTGISKLEHTLDEAVKAIAANATKIAVNATDIGNLKGSSG